MCARVYVLVRAPPVDVSFNLYFKFLRKTIPDVDAFGCFIIKMRIINMYMLQMSAFKVHGTAIIK